MKASIKTFLFTALAGLSALGAHAQSAPKIAVVDLAKLFENYYETKQQGEKLKSQEAEATQAVQAMVKQLDELNAKMAKLQDDFNNPASSSDAKAKAQAAAEPLGKDIIAKRNEVQNYSNNARTMLQNQFNTYKGIAVGRINDVVARIAKTKGVNLVIDKSPNTTYQTSTFPFIDTAAFPDITEEVLKEINRDQPASTVTPAASTAPASGSSAPPSVTFPGAK
jgi:Skp family chaperone for outer membrane proteins